MFSFRTSKTTVFFSSTWEFVETKNSLRLSSHKAGSTNSIRISTSSEPPTTEVPPNFTAALTSLGTAEEVASYCRKLIDIVGRDGGFNLSTGCTCPVDCRIENLQAMVNTAKNYYPH